MKILPATVLFILLAFLVTACSDKEEKPAPPSPSNEFILPDPPQYGIPFGAVPATSDIVMYEVNLRAFSTAGNLTGVTQKLDHIRSLGVNVIWLMPIHPIGTVNSVNSPYSVKNYREVNPEYGTLDDLRRLTDQAHQRGMAVILDWVANHTAWDNPWMKYPAWYTRVNGEVIHPEGTNWLDVADLNFDHKDMRKAMISAMKYWLLAANADGFRCDAADMVPYDFWKQAIDSMNTLAGRKIILLAEGGRSDHFNAGFQLNYGWDFYGKLKSVWGGQAAGGLYATHRQEQLSTPTGKYRLRFTTNHDESAWDATPMTLFNGKKGALAASAITVFMGGVPLIYGSQEVGRIPALPFFSNAPIDWTANPDMLEAYQKMMAIYTSSPPARQGTTTDFSTADVCAFERSSKDAGLLVIVNVRNRESTFEVPGTVLAEAWKFPDGTPFEPSGASIGLEPYQYLMLNR